MTRRGQESLRRAAAVGDAARAAEARAEVARLRSIDAVTALRQASGFTRPI
jgi:hypothetical protein